MKITHDFYCFKSFRRFTVPPGSTALGVLGDGSHCRVGTGGSALRGARAQRYAGDRTGPANHRAGDYAGAAGGASRLEAERRHMQNQAERHRIAELELQPARSGASLAYAACDPDNRLIAAQLEKS